MTPINFQPIARDLISNDSSCQVCWERKHEDNPNFIWLGHSDSDKQQLVHFIHEPCFNAMAAKGHKLCGYCRSPFNDPNNTLRKWIAMRIYQERMVIGMELALLGTITAGFGRVESIFLAGLFTASFQKKDGTLAWHIRETVIPLLTMLNLDLLRRSDREGVNQNFAALQHGNFAFYPLLLSLMAWVVAVKSIQLISRRIL